MRRSFGAGVAVVDTTVIVAGGIRANSKGKGEPSTRTSVATVAVDGTIASWSQGPELGTSRFHGAAVAVGNYVYSLGGLEGPAGIDSTPHVEMATVSGGMLGAWKQAQPYPERRSHQAVAIYKRNLYSIGGLSGNPAGVHTNYATVWRTTVALDGSLGPWETLSELPTPLATHSAVVHADSIYVMGGVAGSVGNAKNSDMVFRADILADGKLGAWEKVSAFLPKARAHAHQTPEHNGFVYSVAGAFEHASMTDVFIGVLK